MNKKLTKAQKQEVRRNRQERAEISEIAVRLLEVFALEEIPLELDMSAMECAIFTDEGTEKMTWGSWFTTGSELVEDRGYGFCLIAYNGSTLTFKVKANNEVYSYGFVRTLDVTEEAVRTGAVEMRLATLHRRLAYLRR